MAAIRVPMNGRVKPFGGPAPSDHNAPVLRLLRRPTRSWAPHKGSRSRTPRLRDLTQVHCSSTHGAQSRKSPDRVVFSPLSQPVSTIGFCTISLPNRPTGSRTDDLRRVTPKASFPSLASEMRFRKKTSTCGVPFRERVRPGNRIAGRLGRSGGRPGDGADSECRRGGGDVAAPVSRAAAGPGGLVDSVHAGQRVELGSTGSRPSTISEPGRGWWISWIVLRPFSPCWLRKRCKETWMSSSGAPVGLAEIDAVEWCCRFDVRKSPHPECVEQTKQSGDGGHEEGELEGTVSSFGVDGQDRILDILGLA